MNNYQKFLINIIVGSFWGLISNVVIGIFLILTLGSIIGFNYLEYILVSSILCISYNYFNIKILQIKIFFTFILYFIQNYF